MEREVRPITSHGDWLRWHDEYVTASSVAALFDCHSFVDRVQLAARMKGLAGTSTSSVPDNAAMKRGRRFEPAVAAAVAEERPGWELVKADTFHLLPAYRLGATPDYWACRDGTPDGISSDGLVQCKTVSPVVWERWAGRPPLMYLLQVVTELLCTDRKWGALACMVMGGSFPVHIYDVPRHEVAEQRILDAVSHFWASLDAGILGDAASTAGLAELLDDGSTVDLSADNELPMLLAEHAQHQLAVKLAEARSREITDIVKAKVGAAARAHLPGWLITYGTHHRAERLMPARDIRTLRIRRSRQEEEEDDE